MVISKNWDCIRSFDELVEDAKFVFVVEKSNPFLVLNTKINGIDCIEISQDRYGLINDAECVFNDHFANSILDSSCDIVEFIYLHFRPCNTTLK